MSCMNKYFLRQIRASGRHGMIPNPLRARGLSTYKMDRELLSSSSSSSSNYDVFFPSFYREYMSNIIEFHASKSEIMMDPLTACYFTEPVTKHPITCLAFEDKPHYYFDIDRLDNEPITIQIGQHFDVISLLSTHSDTLVRIGSNDLIKATDLRGKYVLLCSGFVPSLWIDSHKWRDLSLLSSELSQTHLGRNHFEIVIVPKMRQKWDNDEGVFHHFFSAFPGCLTVPFTHKYRRDYICKSLNFEGQPKFIFVDPSQKVLQVDCGHIVKFGARGFPFTDEHYYSLYDELDWVGPGSPSIESLAGLLCCESNPSFLLRKFDSEETISIEQLNKKHVGLYLFTLGCNLKIIHDIYQECMNQGLDFEIVLVCMPLYSSIDPGMYQDIAHCVLRKYKVTNWWVFPYNYSACAQLSHLSLTSGPDSLFLVGPDNKFVNAQAGSVISYFGFHFGTQMYPFTLEALLKAFLQRLDTVTLESFLTYDYVYRDYECDDSKTMPVSELKGKNVLVYVADLSGNISGWEKELGKEISQWYNIIKQKDCDLEVVFVPVMYVPESEYQKHVPKAREHIFRSKTKWLICPFDESKQSRYLKNHDAFLLTAGVYSATPGVQVPAVLAFGKDGHLHSQNALRLFEYHELDAYPFVPESRRQHLCREITDAICEEFDLCELLIGYESLFDSKE